MRWIFIFFSIFLYFHLYSNVIYVPAEQPTIQSGIDIAVDGDTIMVASGTYFENINIIQKNDIHIIGADAESTIIDGSLNGHVVIFSHASGSIANFSITNSGDSLSYNTGVFTSLSEVNINSNIIYNNSGGIAISSSSIANINNNIIIDNYAHHTIIFSSSEGEISYNLIKTNKRAIDTYISCIDIINNTIIGDQSNLGLVLDPSDESIIKNNIISNFYIGLLVQGAEHSVTDNFIISYNNTWNNSLSNYWEEYGPYYDFYSGPFTPTPGDGNIQFDPLFVDQENGDYHLLENSPCIDAGDPQSPYDPDGTIADIGAFYYHQESYSNDQILNKNDVILSNYPNPFNPSTKIEFSIQDNSEIDISIFNIKGQKVKTLANKEFNQGTHSLIWNGDDEIGNFVPSGVYLYKLNVNGKTESVNKCLLLK